MMKIRTSIPIPFQCKSSFSFSAKNFKMKKPSTSSLDDIKNSVETSIPEPREHSFQPKTMLKNISKPKDNRYSPININQELFEEYRKLNLNISQENMFNRLHSTNNKSIQNFIREAFKLEVDIEHANQAMKIKQEIKNSFNKMREKLKDYGNLIKRSEDVFSNEIQSKIKVSSEYTESLSSPYLVKEATLHISSIISRNSLLSLHTILQPELKEEEINKLRVSLEILIVNKQFEHLDAFICYLAKSEESQLIDKLLPISTLNLIVYDELSTNNCLRFINLALLSLKSKGQQGLINNESTELVDAINHFDLDSLAKNGYLQRFSDGREILNKFKYDPLYLFIELYSQIVPKYTVLSTNIIVSSESLALAFSVYASQENAIDSSVRISMNLGYKSDFLYHLYLKLIEIENSGSIPYGFNAIATHNSYLRLKQKQGQEGLSIQDNVLSFYGYLFEIHDSESYLADLLHNWVKLTSNFNTKSESFLLFSTKTQLLQSNHNKLSASNFNDQKAFYVTLQALINSYNKIPLAKKQFRIGILDLQSSMKKKENSMINTISNELKKKLDEQTNNTQMNHLNNDQKTALFKALKLKAYNLIEEETSFSLEKTAPFVKEIVEAMAIKVNDNVTQPEVKAVSNKIKHFKSEIENSIKEFVEQIKRKRLADSYNASLLKLKLMYIESEERIQIESMHLINKILRQKNPIYSIEELEKLELRSEEIAKLLDNEKYEKHNSSRELNQFYDEFMRFINYIPHKVSNHLVDKLLENKLQLEKITTQLEANPKVVEGYRVFDQKLDELLNSFEQGLNLKDYTSIQSDFDKLEKLFIDHYSSVTKQSKSRFNRYLELSKKPVSPANYMKNVLFNKYKFMSYRCNTRQSTITYILSSKRFASDFKDFYAPLSFTNKTISTSEIKQKLNPFNKLIGTDISKLNYKNCEIELSKVIDQVDNVLLQVAGLTKDAKRIVELLSESDNFIKNLKSTLKLKTAYDLYLANELILFGIRSKNSTSKI